MEKQKQVKTHGEKFHEYMVKKVQMNVSEVGKFENNKAEVTSKNNKETMIKNSSRKIKPNKQKITRINSTWFICCSNPKKGDSQNWDSIRTPIA